jgi:hypothetical protein
MCKILHFISEQKSILENLRQNIFLKIQQKFHEFLGKRNQPGNKKKNGKFVIFSEGV